METQSVQYKQNEQGYCTLVEPTRDVPEIEEDARNGLLTTPRSLPPKYFYDERGAELFEQICSTTEYYPTRTEDALLSAFSGDIIGKILPDQIIELGSGSSRKTRHLFDACEQHAHTCQYAPFDVCEPALNQATDELKSEYGWLDVMPLVGDYHAGLGNLPTTKGSRLFVFLGSTIGNFTPAEAADFIDELRSIMQAGDYFLIGADRIKNVDILHAAYNDADGITAEFNLNVLRVLNNELGANFDLDNFSHEAFFDEEKSRIEMYLTSEKKQQVSICELDETIELNQGEKILTEISRKFDFEELESLLTSSGLNIIKHYEPENQYFSLVLARL